LKTPNLCSFARPFAWVIARKPFLGFSLAATIAFVGSAIAQGTPGECLSSEEQTLFDLFNAYRVENGKAPIPSSSSLSKVAQYHVWDLETNGPVGGECNLHSWSDQRPPDVFWTEVCYTADHAQAQKMWDKPREITENLYTGNGFEIAVRGAGMTPEIALELWKNSPAHRDVLLNLGIWESYDPWPAVGMGLVDGFAVMWFGGVTDPAGPIDECGTSSSVETVFATSHVLGPILPNPVAGGSETASLRLDMKKTEYVQVAIYDAVGRQVRMLFDGSLQTGSHDFSWDTRDLRGREVGSGIYFYRLEVAEQVLSRKFVVTR